MNLGREISELDPAVDRLIPSAFGPVVLCEAETFRVRTVDRSDNKTPKCGQLLTGVTLPSSDKSQCDGYELTAAIVSTLVTSRILT